jgi:hypothetical protein
MRRCRRLLASGWIQGALGVAAIGGAGAFAQDTQTAPAPSPPNARAGADAIAVEVQFVGGTLVGNAAQLNELLEEKRLQYRALLISELHFCRIACDLTKEQSQRIAKQAGVMIEEASARSAQLGLAPRRRHGIRLASDPVPPDAIKVVRLGLEKLVKEHATPAQLGRYQAEIIKREASQRETAMSALVARLDRMLMLTSVQRGQLRRMLDCNWDDQWGTTLGILGDDQAPLPAIPTRLIAPLLSARQQRLWSKFDIQAVNATDAYINYVCEIMEGLPSEFTETVDAAPRGALKPRGAKRGPELKPDNTNRGLR